MLYTKISSKYTTTNFAMKGLRTTFICLMKMLRELDKTKRHNKPLIQPMLGLESSLLLISFFYSNLVIPTPKINFGEDFRPMQFIKHII